MRAVVLHKFDAFSLLLPELEVTVNRAREDKIGSEKRKGAISRAPLQRAMSDHGARAYLVTATPVTVSRCMKDFQYRSAEGR